MDIIVELGKYSLFLAVFAYLFKTLIAHWINKDVELYKQKLNIDAEVYRQKLNMDVEAYKTELQLFIKDSYFFIYTIHIIHIYSSVPFFPLIVDCPPICLNSL